MLITITSIEQLTGDRPIIYDRFECDAIAFTPLRMKVTTDLGHRKIENPPTGISTRMVVVSTRADIRKKDGDRLILPAVGKQQAPVEGLLGRIKEAQGRSPRSVKLLIHTLAEKAIDDHLIFYPYGICPYCGCPIRYPGLDSAYCTSCEWLPIEPDFRYYK